MDDKKHVMPDMWLEYRARHKFQGPHCLCPLLRTINEDFPFTEAEIVLKGSGDYVREYIAECPNRRCEYFGQFPVAFQDKQSLTRRKKTVPLDKIYVLYGIPVKEYALRGK